VRAEVQPSRNDVFRYFTDRRVSGERVSAKVQRGDVDRYPEVNHHHVGGLVDLGEVKRRVVDVVACRRVGRIVGCGGGVHVEYGECGSVGDQQWVGVFGFGRRAGGGAA
jgi:hypothetical protein